MASSPKVDSLFDEFASELITIPPRIANRKHEEYISLLERLLYDNSSPRPPKYFHAIPNSTIESLPTFTIPVEDNDSLREKMLIFPVRMTQLPSGIEVMIYDSEGDNNSNFSTPPEFESFHVDYLDYENLTIECGEIETRFTIRGYALKSNPHEHSCYHTPDDTLRPFSSKIKTNFLQAFSSQKPDVDSWRNNPILDAFLLSTNSILIETNSSRESSQVYKTRLTKISASWVATHAYPNIIVDCPDFEASRARGFVLHSLELQILSFIMRIQYPNLID
ncbi:hypothetical protein Tco_1024995 [Tanacetum coccineum]